MFQISTLVLLLACVHLSLSAAVGTMPRRPVLAEGEGEAFWCSHGIVANQAEVVLKVRKEAKKLAEISEYLLNGKGIDSLHKIDGLKENGECDESIVLPSLPYPALNSDLQRTANAFWNLTHLLQLYHTVWRMMEFHEGYSSASEAATLDMLEIVISRFSNQVERYLQLHRCSCNDTDCIIHQDINKASIQKALQREFSPAGCSRKLFLGKIIANIKTEVIATYKTLNHLETSSLFTSWPLCATLDANVIVGMHSSRNIIRCWK